MANVHKRGDRWRVRWKEPAGHDARGRVRWRDRSRSAPTKRAALLLAREIEESHALGRTWSPEREADVIDLQDGYRLYLEHLVRLQRSPAKFDAVGVAVSRCFSILRARSGARGPLPATLLRRQLLTDLWDSMVQVEELQPSTATRRVRDVEQWWAWMRQAELAGVPEPVRLADLPDRVQVEAPAPTWDEVDAVIRALQDLEGGWGPAARSCWIARCTGLRTSSAISLRWEHLDLQHGELHVPPHHPGSKTAKEKRGWTAPLAPALVDVLQLWRGEGARGAVSGVTGSLSVHRTRVRSRCTEAWQRCEDAGEVRRVVWAPPGRSARPTHAFRACWKAQLARAGVALEVRQALVGGSRGTDAAYVDSGSLPLRQAVDLVPELGRRRVLVMAGAGT